MDVLVMAVEVFDSLTKPQQEAMYSVLGTIKLELQELTDTQKQLLLYLMSEAFTI